MTFDEVNKALRHLHTKLGALKLHKKNLQEKFNSRKNQQAEMNERLLLENERLKQHLKRQQQKQKAASVHSNASFTFSNPVLNPSTIQKTIVQKEATNVMDINDELEDFDIFSEKGEM